jgi:uncharacterized membrane protein YgaE (UPF0421/DUF939 family)
MARDERGWTVELTSWTRLRMRTSVRQAIASTARRLRLHGLRHWLMREREAFVQTAKTALACLLAWLIAKDAVGIANPLLAPVAALIAIQVTVYQSITRSVQYSIGVLFGVGVALVLGKFIGFNALTLLLVVVGSLVLGRTLRLGTQINQVAVTGLLVLSLGNIYGIDRLYDTIIGTAIGVLVNALVMPPTFTGTASKELGDLADDLSDLARDVAKGARGGWVHDESTRWLERARDLTDTAGAVREVAHRAEEAVRFHPRRAAHADDVRRVDAAAVALNHVAAQLNALIRGMNDMSSSGVRGLRVDAASPRTTLPAPLLRLLDDAGQALEEFANLQTADRGAALALERLRRLIRQTRTDFTDAAEQARPDEDDPIMLWPAYGAVLDAAQRMLYELDPDDGPHGGAIPSRVRESLDPPPLPSDV